MFAFQLADEHKENKRHGYTMDDLLDHIIIGPTRYPNDLYRAFVYKLKELGIPNAEEKVIVSDIPLKPA